MYLFVTCSRNDDVVLSYDDNVDDGNGVNKVVLTLLTTCV